MPRPKRILCPDMHYHIIMRGNNQENIFRDDKDRTKFLEILIKYKNKFKVKVYAYVLMSNHIHLFIKTLNPNLSQVMKMINWSYAIYFNRKYKRTGHLFQSRFAAKIVTDEKHFLTIIKYIHLNPVKANIVSKPEYYKWSSHIEYIRGSSDIIDDISEIFDIYWNGNNRLEEYLKFINYGIDNQEYIILNKVRNENISLKLNKLHNIKTKYIDINRIMCNILKTDTLSKNNYYKFYKKLISLKM